MRVFVCIVTDVILLPKLFAFMSLWHVRYSQNVHNIFCFIDINIFYTSILFLNIAILV